MKNLCGTKRSGFQGERAQPLAQPCFAAAVVCGQHPECPARRRSPPRSVSSGPAMSRLLIVACSQRKNPAKGKLPAIDRYDGPVFRVLRKYLREGAEDAPSVFILSAKYGLIAAEREINGYDCRLSASSAERLRPQVLKAARRVLSSCRWQGIGLCAGKDYRVALAGFEELVPAHARVDFIEGGQGPRLSALRRWLREGK
jgi:Family of unknown function (DUF6884)